MIREPWIPDDVPDEDIQQYRQTLNGHKARIEYEAQRIGAPGVLAGLDQLDAKLSDHRDRALRNEGKDT